MLEPQPRVIAFALAFLFASCPAGAKTYRWNAPADSASWSDPASWAPVRTSPATSDTLAFDDGRRVVAYGVPTETVARLVVAAPSAVSLRSPVSAYRQLSVSGDLQVSAGATLGLDGGGSNVLLVSCGPGSVIAGTLVGDGGKSRLNVSSAGALHVAPGGTVVYGPRNTGNVLVTDGGGGAVFDGGSTLEYHAGHAGFDEHVPGEAVRFASGSRLLVRACPGGIESRNYANVEVDVSGSGTAEFHDWWATSSGFAANHVSVRSGTLLFSMAGKSVHILGDLRVDDGAHLSVSEPILGWQEFAFDGSGRQRIRMADTLRFAVARVVFRNPAGFDLETDLTLDAPVGLQSGVVHANGHVFSALSPDLEVTGGSWVRGTARRGVPADTSTRVFPIGLEMMYTPVTLKFSGVANAFALDATATEGAHPDAAAIASGEPIGVWWSLHAAAAGAFASYDASFAFAPSVLPSGASYSRLQPFRRGTGWSEIVGGAISNVNLRAAEVQEFGDFTAVVNPTYLPPIHVRIEGAGAVTRVPATDAGLGPADVTTLNPTPAAGSEFLTWAGDVRTTVASLPLTRDRFWDMTAVYRDVSAPRRFRWARAEVAMDWTDPMSWSPPRWAPSARDTLTFDCGGVARVAGTGADTLSRLVVTNGTSLHFESSAALDLAITGSATALDVSAGATLYFASSSNARCRLLTGAGARIAGRMAVGSGTRQLLAQDPGSVRFVSGSECGTATTYPGLPFGDGTDGSGLGSVVFESGSVFAHAGTGDIFGAPAPDAVTIFEPGSMLRLYTANVVLSGRTLGRLKCNSYGGTARITIAAPATVDSLELGGNLTLTLSAALHVKGALVQSSGTFTVNANVGQGGIVLDGAQPQRISCVTAIATSGLPFLRLDNPAGAIAHSNVSWAGPIEFVRGVFDAGDHTLVLRSGSTLSGAGATTGWVHGRLERSIAAGATRASFPVGDAARYAPVDFSFTGNTTAMNVHVSTTAGMHPRLGEFGPVAKTLARWWRLGATDAAATARFSTVARFDPGDAEVGTNPYALSPLSLGPGGWALAEAGLREPASFEALGLATLGDLAAVERAGACTLSVNVIGDGAVTPVPDLSVHAPGAQVTLTATPGAGYAFSGWSGGASGAANPLRVTLQASRAITATFLQPQPLTVTVTGDGYVTRSPDLPAYPLGTSVVLIAEPVKGSRFTGWTGDAAGEASMTTVVVNGAMSMNAAFEPPHEYRWIGANTPSDVSAASNWSPTRTTRLSNDRLVFDNGTWATLRNTPSLGLSRLVIRGGARVKFQCDVMGSLTFWSDDTALVVEPGSTLHLGGGSPVHVVVGARSRAFIRGTVILGSAANDMSAVDSSAIAFEDGSLCLLLTGLTSHPFGARNSGAGTGSVRFRAGSRLEQRAGLDPFAAAGAEAITVFEAGSRWIVTPPALLASLPGRRIGDLECDPGIGTVYLGGADSLTLDSLFVTTGTLQLAGMGRLNVRGALRSGPGTTLRFARPTGAEPVLLTGDVRQHIGLAGTVVCDPNARLVLDSPAGAALDEPLEWRGRLELVRGTLDTRTHGLSIAGAGSVETSAAGWVNGALALNVPAGNSRVEFPIGDSAHFAPVSILSAGVNAPYALEISTTPGEHPTLGVADHFNARHSVNRWWSTSMLSWSTMDSVSAVLHFSPADLDEGTNPAAIWPVALDNYSIVAGTPGARTPTSVEVRNFGPGLTYSLAEGAPRTVSVASGAHGRVTPPGPTIVVPELYAQPFTFTPDAGYAVAWVSVDGISIGPMTTWTGLPSLGDHTIAVTFTPAPDGPYAAFALEPVSPNPVSGPASVRFVLPRVTAARVTLHDVQGREVAVLAEGVLDSGPHVIAVHTPQARLDAGLYFVRLRPSAGPTIARRFVVVP